jgi:flagellar hook-length control protein FliK
MRVSLFSAPDAGLGSGRVAGLLCAVSDGIDGPWMGDTPCGSCQRGRRDEDFKTSVAATPVPMRSADVINEAERNVEFSSRAFRRQVTREGNTEQFQSDRQAFRDALSAAREGQSRATSSQNIEPVTACASDKNAKAETASGKTNGRGAAKPVSTVGGKPATTSTSARPVSEPHAETNATRSSKSSGAPPVQRTLLPAATMPRFAAGGVPGRIAVAAQAGKSSTSGPAKTGGKMPATTQLTRGVFKAKTAAATKATESRAAQNATRDANTERIVRVLRAQLGQHRSRTTMRLDPPELGSLRLQMDLRGEALTLRIDTTTSVAHRLLSEDLEKLRHGLEALGIQLERADIRPPALPAEAGEQAVPQWSESQSGGQSGSSQADAEHPGERGTDSHPASAAAGASRGDDRVPTAEPLVNVIA